MEQMTINGRQYVVTSRLTFDETTPLATAHMNSNGIAGFATVKLSTGRVEKAIYVTTSGQFGGWLKV